jgi:hypothetical protein
LSVERDAVRPAVTMTARLRDLARDVMALLTGKPPEVRNRVKFFLLAVVAPPRLTAARWWAAERDRVLLPPYRAIATAWYAVTAGLRGMNASNVARPPSGLMVSVSGGVVTLFTTLPALSSASTRIESLLTALSPLLIMVPTTLSTDGSPAGSSCRLMIEMSTICGADSVR